jgi:hypothetical protein
LNPSAEFYRAGNSVSWAEGLHSNFRRLHDIPLVIDNRPVRCLQTGDL